MSFAQARAEISNVLARYARSVDRKDWQSLRDCFASDCIDRHGPFTGNPEEFVAWVQDRHANMPFSTHHILNVYIEMKSETHALVETNFWAVQSSDPESEPVKTYREVFGRYFDEFALQDDAWKISKRNVIYDASRRIQAPGNYAAPVGLNGTRDTNDPADFTKGPQ